MQPFEDSVESNRFKSFLESKHVDKYKNALFLILNRTAAQPETETKKTFEKFVNLFARQEDGSRQGIGKDQIILINTKAKLYYNTFQHLITENIKAELKEMGRKKAIEPFLKDAWQGSDGKKMRSSGN